MKTKLTPKLMLCLAAPQTFAASVCPALYGLICCGMYGLKLRVLLYVTLPAAVILLQSAVNTLNDYADFMKGTDSREDALEENDAVLLYSGIEASSALRLGIAFLLAGAALGLISCCCSGYFLMPLLIGAAGVLTVMLYSLGPAPLSYLPVGELISGALMGIGIPLGICACADGGLHTEILPGTLPFFIGIALIMLCNNGCDIEKDRAAGRKTFPAALGRPTALLLYRILLVLWLLFLLLLPLKLFGTAGLLILPLFLLTAGKQFLILAKLRLLPENRILQMKSIGRANLSGNGSFCLVLLLCLLLGTR